MFTDHRFVLVLRFYFLNKCISKTKIQKYILFSFCIQTNYETYIKKKKNDNIGPSGRSLEANDLLSGQSDELVKVKLDVLPPVTSVFAVGLSRITRTA